MTGLWTILVCYGYCSSGLEGMYVHRVLYLYISQMNARMHQPQQSVAELMFYHKKRKNKSIIFDRNFMFSDIACTLPLFTTDGVDGKAKIRH